MTASVKTLTCIGLFLALLLGSCTPKTPYSVSDGRFVRNGEPQYYIGTNFWYGPILATTEEGRARLSAELDSLKALGMTNLRVLTMADGEGGQDAKIRPAWHKAPGEYDSEGLEGLGYFLKELEKRDMTAVLYLNNAWEWSGGYGTYLEWVGEGTTPDTRTEGYGPYVQFVGRFITNARAQELFFDHVRTIVSRYKDSPAIFSWQIANEPRCFSDVPAVRDSFVTFIHSTAALIKSIDPVHMVSTGNEGLMGCEKSMELVERINSCDDIDYMTIHIWPYNWRWIEEGDIAGGVDGAIVKTDEYIDRHLALARRLRKPLVIEEFGYPRDGFAFEKGTPVSGRDRYYAHVFSRIAESAEAGGQLAGLNFWGWGGLARQVPGREFWQEGDDYCGDPAQEAQGLNSVYLSDTSTVGIIRENTRRLAGTVKVHPLLENDWLYVGDGRKTLNLRAGSAVDATAQIDVAFVTDLSLMAEKQDTACAFSTTLKLKAGKGATVPVDFDLAPGFYQVRISVDGRNLDFFNIGVNPEMIQSPQDKAADFDAFWAENVAKLAEVPVDAVMTLMPERSTAERNVYRVLYISLGNVTVGGILAIPNKEGRFPAYIEYMGYGSDVYPYWGGSNPDAIQFLVSVRGQGLFREVKEGRWIDKGLGSKDTFYYRGAFCDALRAVDFVAGLEKTDPSMIFGLGESQGGALSLVAASLDHRFRAISAAVPFLGDYPDYAKIVWWPVWEVFGQADSEGISREELFATLSYFDVKNFTDRIECPVLMSFGLQDPTCPPHTNFAGYNQIRSEKKYWCAPLCGHGMWEQKPWLAERQAWFASFTGQTQQP